MNLLPTNIYQATTLSFYITIILLIIATIFLFVDKSDFAGWSNFVIWIFGSYCVGNGLEHLSGDKK